MCSERWKLIPVNMAESPCEFGEVSPPRLPGQPGAEVRLATVAVQADWCLCCFLLGVLFTGSESEGFQKKPANRFVLCAG